MLLALILFSLVCCAGLEAIPCARAHECIDSRNSITAAKAAWMRVVDVAMVAG